MFSDTEIFKSKNDIDIFLDRAETDLVQVYKHIDRIGLIVQERILRAFREHHLTEEFFAERTGYGIDDIGRDVIDEIFADIFEAEACACRVQFVSGTHAIACAIMGNMASGQRMVGLTGRPYDTLLEVIGIDDKDPGQLPQRGSLRSFGVDYAQIDCVDMLDLVDSEAALVAAIKDVGHADLYHIQKSRGYSMQRKTLSNVEIGQMIQAVRRVNPDSLVFVDNCYGEFVEEHEPIYYGADIVAGSLIKNPGGGMALTGGYVAGRKQCVEGALMRLTAPGIGGHLGITFNQNRSILQGVFIAPSVVGQAVKGAHLAARVFEKLGLKTFPDAMSPRYDLIQAVEFGDRQRLIDFCVALQKFSPVNAHVSPEPSGMPGYADQVIMAGGSFIEGATIELSADGPLRPPYAGYMQGGLSYLHVKCAMKGILELCLTGAAPFA